MINWLIALLITQIVTHYTGWTTYQSFMATVALVIAISITDLAIIMSNMGREK